LILPDVNILVYAFRGDCKDHSRYRAWLLDVVNGREAYGIAPQVVASMARITTHPSIFVQPSRLEEALQFGQSILNRPHCQPVLAGPRHWNIFESLCRDSKAKGNLVQDAWFAALAMEHGCEWITTDRDYARFPGLRWREPFDQGIS
jgi:toxin-antitoxin system PIN domain toxin